MDLLYLKATHIVFVVSWFSALFYVVRLFIYTAEAQQRDENAKILLTTQLLLMQRKLFNIIGWPAMIGTVITGGWMLLLQWQYYLSQPWMWLKLISVVLLIFYHIRCYLIMRAQHRLQFRLSSIKLRLFNELATVFLVAIVFLVVLKSTSGFLWGILGLLVFAACLMLAVFIYRKRSKARLAEGNTPEITPE